MVQGNLPAKSLDGQRISQLEVDVNTQCGVGTFPVFAHLGIREDTARSNQVVSSRRLWAPQKTHREAWGSSSPPGGLGDLMHMERPTELKHINQWRK